MITSDILKAAKLFAGLREDELTRLAQRAGDIRLEPAEWLIREGERQHFFGTKPLEPEVVVNFITDNATLLLQARNHKADVTLGLVGRLQPALVAGHVDQDHQ